MNNAFWRELLDFIPGPVLLFRIDEAENAHLMFANDSITALSGYSPADLVLESEQNALMQQALAGLIDAIAVHSHEKTAHQGEWEFPVRAGGRIPVLFSYRIFTSRAVNQPFICVMLQAVSEKPAAIRSVSEAGGENDIFVAESPSLKAIIERFTWFAGQPVNMVFTGETGNGKRTLATRFLRYLSGRSAVDFALFDAKAGGDFDAFLSGKEPVKAVWNLDNLPLEQQRLLVERASLQTRIVATSESALELLLDRGLVLPELVYNLNFVSLTVPPLHRRKDDALAFLSILANRFVPVFDAAEDAAEAMRLQIQEPDWDGSFASIKASYRRLCTDMEPSNDFDDPQFELFGEAGLPGPLTFNEYNRAFLKTVLKFTKGKIYGDDGAAKLLGLKPTTLQSKLKKLGIR